MEIREAMINDIPELVGLMEQLGYPTSVDKMKSRINAISSNASYHTLVVDYNGRVVGMAGFCSNLFYEYDGSYVRIVAFVVDLNYRRKGIGEKLIQRRKNGQKNRDLLQSE